MDQLGIVDVADVEVDRQPVARQADPPALQVVAQLFVLDRVEAIVAADPGGLRVPFRTRDIVGRSRDREKMIDGRAENTQKLAGLRAAVGEVVDVGPAMVGKRSRAARRSCAEPEACNTAGGIIACVPASRVANVPCGVDAEVVNDRLHRKRKRVVERRLGALHDRGDLFLKLVVAVRGDEKRHPAARHAAEHQEPPEVVAERLARLADDRLGERIGHPGDDPLQRAVPVPRGQAAEPRTSAAVDGRQDLIEDLQGFEPGQPLVAAAEQVLGGDHIEDRADVLRHPAVNQDQAPGECVGKRVGVMRQSPEAEGRGRSGVQQAVGRQQAAAADAPFGVTGARPRLPR